MMKNYLLCGIGGQGTVLTSKLIAYAALKKGLNVKTTETIGMAQRGGSVVSHVRTNDGVIHTNLVPKGKADVIIAFEPGEAVRCLPYLKEGGTVITGEKAIVPVTASLKGSNYNAAEMLDYLATQHCFLYRVDTDNAASLLGTSKATNVFLLGAAIASGALDFTEDEMKDTITGYLNEKFHALNIKALELGISFAEKQK